jgi:hypothetical protein
VGCLVGVIAFGDDACLHAVAVGGVPPKKWTRQFELESLEPGMYLVVVQLASSEGS